MTEISGVPAYTPYLRITGARLPARDAEEGRDRQEDFTAQIAAYLRHQSAQRRGGTGGHLALLGHSTINTTQIYTNVGQDRMAVVARL